ncbi:MAG: cyclase family protein [Dehalococcoidia bacterium]|nr:cyclase family protein [Dehalococcoidia bacterium]
MRCREHGYWGGRTENPTAEHNELGIEHWAKHGVAGRGVLIDVAGWLAEHEPGYDPLSPRPITVDELRATLDAQGASTEPGDIWCVRTGWPGAYRKLEQSRRESYAAEPTSAGLHAGEETARFTWNAHPAALCCDNPAVEVVPGDPAVGSLHRRLLPTLGMALGEMFDFEALAGACRADGRWTFFFAVATSSMPRSRRLGFTGNAVAIRQPLHVCRSQPRSSRRLFHHVAPALERRAQPLVLDQLVHAPDRA